MDHSQIYSCHRWHKELSNFVTFVLLIEQSIINTDDFHSCKQRSAGEPVWFDRTSASNLLSLKPQNSPCLPLTLLSCSVLAPWTLPLPLNATWHGTYAPTFSHLQSQNKLQALLSLAAHWQWKLKCKSSSLCAMFCYYRKVNFIWSEQNALYLTLSPQNSHFPVGASHKLQRTQPTDENLPPLSLRASGS